jgi:hypothetical protein
LKAIFGDKNIDLPLSVVREKVKTSFYTCVPFSKSIVATISGIILWDAMHLLS